MTTWTREALHSLNEILATLYLDRAESVKVVTDVGLNPARIAFKDQALLNWFYILEEGQKQSRVDQIVEHAFKEFPENDALKRAQAGMPPPSVPAPDIKNATWHGPDKSKLEKLMGKKSTLVHVNYLQRGVNRSRSVVRIVHPDGSSGTGFLATGDLLVTNNHVLNSEDDAKKAIVQFNYQKTADGMDAAIEQAELDPDNFFKTSVDDDWTIVRMKGNWSDKWGAIELKRVSVREGDHVNIIQHAGGGQKQISISANTVVFAGEGRVQYLTDTLPGSSGSPVYDESWNVVALHHSGGWLSEPNSSSKTTYYRNEGIDINLVIDGLP